MSARVARLVAAVSFLAAAAAISAILLLDAKRVYESSDAELTAFFYGAAYEDIFGFGFWATWMLFAICEVTLLALGWLVALPGWLRRATWLVLAVFLLGSIINHGAFMREHQLWVTYWSAANAL
jgi:hypothetical protein